MMLISAVIITIFMHIARADDYVEEVLQKCNTTGLSYICDKYRLLNFVKNFEFEWNSDGIVSVIKIPVEKGLISLPQYSSDDGEYVKFFKFINRKAVSFLETHTIAFQLPKLLDAIERQSSDMSVVASRGGDRHQKISFIDRHKMKIVSKIVLFKLLKIKFLLSIVLFVILSVKTVLIFAALIYPFIYQGLITSCQKIDQGWWGWG